MTDKINLIELNLRLYPRGNIPLKKPDTEADILDNISAKLIGFHQNHFLTDTYKVFGGLRPTKQDLDLWSGEKPAGKKGDKKPDRRQKKKK